MANMTPMGLPANNITPMWIQKVLRLHLQLIPLVLFCAFILLSVKIYQILHVFYPTFEISAFDITRLEKFTTIADTKTTPQIEIPPKVFDNKKTDRIGSDTPEKLRVLTSLAKLREDLEVREKALQKKELLLKALQEKIDERINQLTRIDSKLKETLKTTQKEELYSHSN